jgi:hypothetical protein
MYLELLLLLVPILRVLKITRHSSGWRLLLISIGDCLQPLLVPAFLLVLMTVFASCVIFWVEKHFACSEHCGDEDPTMAFESIPHTMWFTIVTISTVGYGDVSPNTDAAKFVSSALILAGVCYMAMPLAIIGGTFSQVWDDRDRILMREKTRGRLTEGGVTVDDLRVLFEAADADGSGYVSRNEFVELVDAFQLGLTRSQVLRLFKSMDDNNSNSIAFEEFVFFLFPELEIQDESETASKTCQTEESHSASIKWREDGEPPEAVEAWEDNGKKTAASRQVPPSKESSKDEVLPMQVHQDNNRMEVLDRRLTGLEALISDMRSEQQEHFEAQKKLLKVLSETPILR